MRGKAIVFAEVGFLCYHLIMANINTDIDKIKELLERGTEDILVKEDLEKELTSGKELRIKFGIDPTGPKIHIGRAIPLRKLREFQRLGHKIVLIVGDFTAQIGDASDKTEKRPMIDRMQIEDNMKDYKNQIGKILDLSKTEFRYNSDWLAKLNFAEITKLAECFTVQQMLARRNFKDRYDAGTEISLREFLYPIMQGYDSVAVESDVEVGGFDQLFNLKAGRVMQEYYGQKKQNILTFQMLEGTDGRKMSTSWGNIITIVDEPFDMYGKVMSLRDDLIIKYFTLCTDKTLAEVEEYKVRLESGENPKNLKMILAKTMVTQYHDDKQAALAEANFVEVFEKGGVPDVIDEYITNTEDKTLGDCAVNSKVVESKAEWKRLVESGAVTLDEQQVEDFRAEAKSGILKVGKRRFLRIKA